MLAFKSWDGPVEGVHLHLHPFRWDALVVQLQGAKWDEAAVTRWFDRWFGMMKDTPVVTPVSRPVASSTPPRCRTRCCMSIWALLLSRR